MRLRLVAGYVALAAALGGACGGRVTDVGSPGEAVQDSGAPRSSAPEARSTDDAGSTLDASVTVDATPANDFDADCPLDLASIVVDLPDGGTCTVPREAEVEKSGCGVGLPGFSGSCPSDYVIVCGDNARCPLHWDPRCTSVLPSVGGELCCPCDPGGSSEAGSYDAGGAAVGGGGSAAAMEPCWNGSFFTECPPGSSPP